MKNLKYFIPIFIFMISCVNDQKQNIVSDGNFEKFDTAAELKRNKNPEVSEIPRNLADTITNWQFYKDSDLLFKSNIFEPTEPSAQIKITDKYESLYLTLFYDFNNEIIKKKIELISNDKVIATFADENYSRSPFHLPKSELDKLKMENLNEELLILYSDQISKNSFLIGILKFIEE